MARAALTSFTALVSATNSTNEVVIPVTLWDSAGDPVTRSGQSARYVIGEVSLGGRSQKFTFDAGNPNAPILLAEGCKGCSTGCPSTVPQCSSGASACWSSHPNDFAPSSSFVASSSGCPSGVRTAGTLDGVTVCTQCFGGSSHSRFYTMAEGDVTFSGASGDVTLQKLRFGALVRTAPATDRVWSNVGVGYQSEFLQQLGASSVLFHLRPSGGSQVIFNPSLNRYAGAQSASFTVGSNREHSISNILVGSTTIDTSGLTFHIDTGNAGITIADSSVLSQLTSAGQGLTPETAPDLVIVLDGISVTLPGLVWMKGRGQTVFSSYHKNVLGLPFLSAGDIVFDDAKRQIYVTGSMPPAPTPPAPPTPPSPTPSTCMARCNAYAAVCDCDCFCSCGGVCGNGCYTKCKTVRGSCGGNCPSSYSNQTALV